MNFDVVVVVVVVVVFVAVAVEFAEEPEEPDTPVKAEVAALAGVLPFPEVRPSPRLKPEGPQTELLLLVLLTFIILILDRGVEFKGANKVYPSLGV